MTEEFRVANAPVRLHFVADRQSGPILLKYAPEHIKHDILPRICRGELCFVIGMSEPGSGSDLFAAKTKATKVDGGWRINGSKIWTSNAHIADYMLGLFRTSPSTKENRRHGLTQFLVDMKAPGITVNPIYQMTGQHDFNEVVFDDAFDPGRPCAGRDRWRVEAGDQRTRLRAQRAGAFPRDVLCHARTDPRARPRARRARRRRARPPGRAAAHVAAHVGLGRRHAAGRQGAGGGRLDRQGRRHDLGAETAAARARTCGLPATARPATARPWKSNSPSPSPSRPS